ncbi:MAG: hypothetical protein EWV49_20490 [Microcystis aeruginosa Ma_QC_Ch_20071001_S25]|jgi:hypothetical protein|uniref:DUF2281 domain-containing protein n=2 Tax=Microcystis aeruginosa TaxID=1126 RepID=A0A552FWU2_MICAE|nr:MULTISPECIES: hypothetical protein [unclassified Microcystis]MCA2764890.1 hypothetical protein [Microcystis sp. M151S2]MCU7241700.1 hypothetical protein [Microcystis aeruginosa WS75]NCQ68354.1 hypothetical protein [Microcystis aeruginosa W13-16]NCQ72863.1 hypothetical protein [Microcystis aeruginosa W13-13]NCQ77450.1 hypothetical protein [Microcystis aeruginosa W13-15]NCQ85411.1 hypothetical protein [Microcystis aeruginosa W13-18]NCR14174.1 hypothetical protein [Microcystis aeruginosa SX1
MTLATTHQQTILEKLQTLNPQQQQQVIEFIEFLQLKADKTAIHEEEREISALESAGDLVGCLDSGKGDLSLKKREFKKKHLV